MRSYEAAVGLLQANLLRLYIGGFYFKPESLWGKVVRLFVNGRGSSLEARLRGRHHPDLPPERVLSFPAADVVFQCLARSAGLQGAAHRFLPWRNRWFDERVARTLERERPAAVLCYDGCALRAFEQAKSLGILSVLDQCTAHVKTGLRLFREEAERHPEWADSLPALEAPEWWIEQFCRELELADAVFISSDYAKRTLLENGVAEEKTFVIPYGAEINRFRPRHTQSDGPFRVLFVGQVTQRKGVKYLLEAFRQLALPNAELLLVGGIAGSGKGLEAYRGLFTHTPSVPYPELHKYFQLGSIFVMPSLHEGSVLAIQEALASGLPVIATPNSGSVVRDGIEGFIVPIRDVEALKEKILQLYQNKELREEMGRRARKRAEDFTWAAYHQRVSELFCQLLEVNSKAQGDKHECEKP
jgi:glycosyltransferase involved in cell wall biosynthesis